MKKGLLKLMKCPYCGTDFEIEDVYEENDDEIINGCIRCECDTYPILGGILILKNDNTKRYILEFLKKGNVRDAVAFSISEHIGYVCDIMSHLESGAHYKLKKILFALVRARYLMKNTYKKYSDKKLSFWEVLGSSPFEIYLKHRFSSSSFWSFYPFVPLLKRNRKRILDLGCGTGHASFIISKYVNPDELVCVDREFKSLYLAKKYFAKDAEFICLDADYSLPFKKDIFTSILMMDAFQCVNAQALLVKELERVLKQEGLLLLLHLHNRLVENVVAVKSLSPSTWKGLFDNLNVIALPEKSIVEDFILRGRLDLSKEYSKDELNSSDAISIIGGDILGYFDGIWNDILEIKDNLIINPLYKMKEEANSILLYKMKEEANSILVEREKTLSLTKKYLPERCEIDKRFVERRRVCVPESDEIEELMRKFVIINVPEKYI